MVSGNIFKLMTVFQVLMDQVLALLSHMENKFGSCYFKNVGQSVLKVIKLSYLEVQNKLSLLWQGLLLNIFHLNQNKLQNKSFRKKLKKHIN